MSTAVVITDRSAGFPRTDNIVVVAPAKRRLLWVPRDLWSTTLEDRINVAFGEGGHAGLVTALAEYDIRIEHSICIRRGAVERAIHDLVVDVPVSQTLVFWYPLLPQARIQDGRKLISFVPPAETLSGERIHQWIGARLELSGTGSDLARIRRQQVLLRAMLEAGFDFNAVFDDREQPLISSHDAVVEASQIRADWRFDIVDGLVQTEIFGRSVLVRRRRRAWLPGRRGG